MEDFGYNMELNNLNIPPTEEPFGKKLSRVASQFIIPVLIPASSAFIGWLYQRRISSQLTELRKEKDHIAGLKDENLSLQAKVDGLRKQHAHLTSQENLGMEVIRRRQTLEKAILREEDEATRKILMDLEAMRPLLKKRQGIYCNMLVHRSNRYSLEKDLLNMAYAQPYDKSLGLYVGMEAILKHDTSCGLGHDSQPNGCLMWLYLDFWKTKAELLKHQRVRDRMRNIDESFTH